LVFTYFVGNFDRIFRPDWSGNSALDDLTSFDFLKKLQVGHVMTGFSVEATKRSEHKSEWRSSETGSELGVVELVG
jgi:hypothetical protein